MPPELTYVFVPILIFVVWVAMMYLLFRALRIIKYFD